MEIPRGEFLPVNEVIQRFDTLFEEYKTVISKASVQKECGITYISQDAIESDIDKVATHYEWVHIGEKDVYNIWVVSRVTPETVGIKLGAKLQVIAERIDPITGRYAKTFFTSYYRNEAKIQEVGYSTLHKRYDVVYAENFPPKSVIPEFRLRNINATIQMASGK